jgi:ABC-type Co2+ transport system permease subunit
LGPFDAVNHVFGLLLPALVVGPLAAALVKWMWRSELRAVRWRRLASWAAVAAAIVLVAGLVIFGHDGAMATYGAMIVAMALALWWAGFGPGRRQ